MANLYELYTRKKSMELIKNQISTTLTKGEMNTILAEAMQDETTGASIKRLLGPFIANSFTQFPEHTNVTLSGTDENGITEVILKASAKKKETLPLSSEEIDEIIDSMPEPEDTVETTPEI